MKAPPSTAAAPAPQRVSRLTLCAAVLTGILAMGGSRCPSKTPSTAAPAPAVGRSDADKARDAQVAQLEGEKASVGTQIQKIDTELAAIEQRLDDLRFSQGVKGVLVELGTADAADAFQAGLMQLSKEQLKQRRADLTKQRKGLVQRQRDLSNQIADVRDPLGAPGNGNTGRNTALTGTRTGTRTGTGPGVGMGGAHSPPPAHSHH